MADDFRGEANAHKWQYILTDADIVEIEAALKSIVEKGIKIEVHLGTASCFWGGGGRMNVPEVGYIWVLTCCCLGSAGIADPCRC